MLLGFKAQFKPMILAHEKRHTIRAYRKIAPRVGETCHCYTGLRQKGATLLGRWLCTKVQTIQIYDEHKVVIDGVRLGEDEREALARSDGFESFTEMMEFWKGRLPFHGVMIHWDPEKPL